MTLQNRLKMLDNCN